MDIGEFWDENDFDVLKKDNIGERFYNMYTES